MAVAILASVTSLSAREDTGEVVAAYSSVSPAYKRTVQADGSFKPESYAFGEGGAFNRAVDDPSFAKLKFIDVARVVAPSLAKQNYVPCDPKVPQSTDLLIMVYWGTTIGTDNRSSSSEYALAQAITPPALPPPPPPPDASGGAAMSVDPGVSGADDMGMQRTAQREAAASAQDQAVALMMIGNRNRDRQDLKNAEVLGYLPELERVDRYRMTGLSSRRQDVLAEVEESRYYVVLLAYDFQTLRRQKARRMLWETRFSVPERGREFDKTLAAMTEAASRYFGRSSEGLQRTTLRGTVELGELKVIEEDVGAKK
jgi:hypothetical protein